MADTESSCCCSTQDDESSCCGQGHEEDASCCCGQDAEKDTSCCCGGEGDSHTKYSSEDDPYNGHKKTVIVDFLFLDLTCCDRCQGTDERVARAVERCRPVLSACGYNLVLNQIYVETPQLAERYRFESSPTIRVDGVDICPSIEENDCDCCSDISDAAVKCRIFPFNGTYYEVPPTDMLVRGIMEVVLGGRRAEASATEYVMPQNLIDFYEGKTRKQAATSCC